MEGKYGQQDGWDREGATNAFVMHYLLCTEQLNRVADMHLLIEMTYSKIIPAILLFAYPTAMDSTFALISTL